MKRKHKYCENHKIVKSYADGGKVAKKGKKRRRKATPEMLGSGAASMAGEALRDTRREQMDELGLKDGGKVRRKCG